MNDTLIIETHGLKKTYGKVCAVDEVNLQVQSGEVFGFLGPNGAGKTTTIGMLLSLVHPTAGEIRLFGEPLSVSRTSPLNRVGALVGSPALVPYLSARQNLGLVARLHPGLQARAVEQTLERVGLSEAADRHAGDFSTGMKQRLGLAMALLHKPELLIFDEPTNGMDPAGMREIRLLLRELASQGVTVFLSSHLLNEVEQVCDRVAVLNKGRVVAQGLVSELLGAKDAQVKVRVASPAEAAVVLLTLPGVEEALPNGLYVTVRGVPAQSVVAHLAAHGIFPSEVSSGQANLESLFLELTV